MHDAAKPLMEHVEELRRRLIVSFVAVVVAAVAVFPFTGRVIAFLARAGGPFIFLGPTEAIFSRMKIAVLVGAVFALPVVLYQAWRFVFVALSVPNRKSLIWILPSSYLLFVSGFSFSFFLMVPAGVAFLRRYGSADLRPSFSIDVYLNFVGALCLATAAVFQMPLVSFFAARLGVLPPTLLSEKRRLAVLLIYVFSALITPGPDPVTAVMMFVPTYLLFELSVLSAKIATDKKQ